MPWFSKEQNHPNKKEAFDTERFCREFLGGHIDVAAWLKTTWYEIVLEEYNRGDCKTMAEFINWSIAERNRK